MKIPWPDHYTWLDKILATTGAVVVIAIWIAAFVLGMYFYFFGG